jgi:hypothetical protein
MPILLGDLEPELDQPIRTLSARLWAGVAALAIALAAAVSWGWFGSLSRHLNATGVIASGGVTLFTAHGADAARLAAGERVFVVVGGAALPGHLDAVDPIPQTGTQLSARFGTALPGVPMTGDPVWTATVVLDRPVPTRVAIPVQITVELPDRRPYQVLFGTTS